MIKVSVIIPVYNQETLLFRAIESVPIRDDVEIIVIDDGSTDNTWNNLLMFREDYSNPNFVVLYNSENKGVAYTVNRGLDIASGEYIVLLGSDDYLYTEEFVKAIESLDGTDLIYFDLKINDGNVWKVTNESKYELCGSVKFMRREFIGDIRNPEHMRHAEDAYFYRYLMSKNPTEKFLNKVVKHYNFPRKNSLVWLAEHKLI